MRSHVGARRAFSGTAAAFLKQVPTRWASSRLIRGQDIWTGELLCPWAPLKGPLHIILSHG